MALNRFGLWTLYHVEKKAAENCNGYHCADRNPDAICYTNARADRPPCRNRVTHANARRHADRNTEGTNHVLQLCGYGLLRS